MRQNAQKPAQKFCGSKEGKNNETHPKSSEKGETGCVSGAGGRCSQCGRVGKPKIRTKMHHMAIQHMKKENRRKPSVFAGFVAGAEGLGLGCRLGRFAAERHWRSLTPRHALRRAQPHLVAESLCALTKNREASIVLASLFLAGAEGLEPSARGFGVDVGKRTGGTGEGPCCPVSNASPGEDGAGLVLWEIFRAKTGEKEREIPEKT